MVAPHPADETCGFAPFEAGDRAVVYHRGDDAWVYGARLPPAGEEGIVRGWFDASVVIGRRACTPPGGLTFPRGPGHAHLGPGEPTGAGVGGGIFPPEDVKWISLPGSQELALCVAHCLPDPTGIFRNAHNELGYAAPSFDWADESEPPKAQPEFPTRIAAVRRAFAIGK